MGFHPCELAKEVVQKEKAWRVSWEGCSTGCKATSQGKECSLLCDACCQAQHMLSFLIVKKQQQQQNKQNNKRIQKNLALVQKILLSILRKKKKSMNNKY